MTRDTEEEVKPCKFVGGACVNCDATERGDCQGFVYNTYTPREWVGLTDDEISLIVAECSLVSPSDHYFAQAIEQALKERNNG